MSDSELQETYDLLRWAETVIDALRIDMEMFGAESNCFLHSARALSSYDIEKELRDAD